MTIYKLCSQLKFYNRDEQSTGTRKEREIDREQSEKKRRRREEDECNFSVKVGVYQQAVQKFQKSRNRVTTNYGERVRVEFYDCVMYLPERYSRLLTNELLTEINEATVVMSYSGKDPEAQNRLLLDFDAIRTDEAGEVTSSVVMQTPLSNRTRNSNTTSDGVSNISNIINIAQNDDAGAAAAIVAGDAAADSDHEEEA